MSVLIAAMVMADGSALAEAAQPTPVASSESFTATLQVRADRPGATISRNIYGSFAEHLGRGIYEGVWVGEDSPIPNTRGLRNDVIAALKKIKLPVLRWPGGCFADEYHWRDGIGPRAKRPRRANTSWGGVETNAFGLHEFMDFVALIGAEPYINVNVGTGSPREMMDWLEYMTASSDSSLAQLRRENGRQQPWQVKFVGIGNETWGCGGNMRPEYYADEYKRYATFVKKHGAEEPVKIAVGPSDEDYNWTEVVMKQAAKHIDGLTLHYYTLPTGNWKAKGSATQFDEAAWRATLLRTLRMDEFISKHSAIMDKYDPEKRVALIVDEWGTWYDEEPGKGALYQQSSLRDALVAALNLNLFNQHAERVRMAASAQTINVLQAMILTDQGKMLLTPTYHVFDLYQVHHDATSIPVEARAPRYGTGADSLPSVHASASRDRAGVLHVSIVNLDPARRADVTLNLKGHTAKAVTGRVLTGAAINSKNDFDSTSVEPKALRGELTADGVKVSLPSKSVVMLTLQ
ncbi:MAG TPA: alpha-L-arabinofuranosidase C-terminal domain-containing protein [Polyangiaceae bacterium]|nr:alpha-L-arabinofuranosidase C-terminal domain-containing protein [Polyangiaceae bacterium]